MKAQPELIPSAWLAGCLTSLREQYPDDSERDRLNLAVNLWNEQARAHADWIAGAGMTSLEARDA